MKSTASIHVKLISVSCSSNWVRWSCQMKERYLLLCTHRLVYTVLLGTVQCCSSPLLSSRSLAKTVHRGSRYQLTVAIRLNGQDGARQHRNGRLRWATETLLRDPVRISFRCGHVGVDRRFLCRAWGPRIFGSSTTSPTPCNRVIASTSSTYIQSRGHCRNFQNDDKII
jgi:hypothetical protein